MTVLVTTATRHGATTEIADVITRVLIREGVSAECVPMSDVHDVERYSEVVLGSAVYVGKWLKEARGFVGAHEEALRGRPVWLFSSGPVGESAKTVDPEVDVAAIVSATAAREHRMFGGKLDRAQLNIAERVMVRAVGAPEGDDRDWPAIEQWATGIATACGVAGGVR